MNNDSKIYRKQLTVVSLLILFPVIMIFFNGKKAIEGLFWEGGKAEISLAEEIKNYPQIRFGYYDPSQTWKKESPWEMELLYISWLYFNQDTLKNQLQNILSYNIKPFITIEPWARENDQVLKGIVQGKYDDVIDQLKYSFHGLNDTIYISWGHEMDQTLTERYSWSAQSPEDFVAAFRYFHDKFKEDGYLIKWIWAPVVNENSHNYWPGIEYIDVVGMPVYAFPAFDVKNYGYVRKFEETFGEKYNLLKSYNKPIFIKEFGVSGPEKFKRDWFEQAFFQIKNYPLLRGIIFFNSEDTPGVWGGDMSTPDWRIREELALDLVKNYSAGKFY